MLPRLPGEGAFGTCLSLPSMLLLEEYADMSIHVDAENSNANPHAFITSVVTTDLLAISENLFKK